MDCSFLAIGAGPTCLCVHVCFSAEEDAWLLGYRGHNMDT